MFIIAGLGNPGKAYHKTKHNAGFMVIDNLAEKNGIQVKKIKHNALIGEGTVAGQKVVLVKPQTYMNLSGIAVQKLMDYYKAGPDQLIVIYDDVDIKLGKIRIRPKGSSGTHNGMRSIVEQIGSEAFSRIRVGIGKEHARDLADFVLSHFSKADRLLIDSAVADAANAAEAIIQDGIDKAMNEYNRKDKNNDDNREQPC